MDRNVLQRRAGTQHRPITFVDVARHVARNPSPCWVQVRVKGVVLCGRLTEVGSPNSQREYFKVHTELGESWASARDVRMCSGDGRCACEPSRSANGAPATLPEREALPPYGNTGVTGGAEA